MSSCDMAMSYVAGGVNLGGEKVLGRQKAIELLYRGHIRWASERINALVESEADERLFLHLCAEEGRGQFERRIIRGFEVEKLAQAGATMTLDPALSSFAWARRSIGDRAYSLVGLTHTLSSMAVIEMLNAYHLAPIQEWDGLICTSHAAKSAVERLLQHGADLYEERLGKRPVTKVQLPVIPLPVECKRFALTPSDEQDCAALRQRLAIGADDCVFLYFGRLSYHAKAHPFPLFHGLQQVTRQTKDRKITLLMVGQAYNPSLMAHFRQAAIELCPDVAVHFLDGLDDALCRLAWGVADVFVSLSDNLQETFGLTVVEAMAAGLPVIASDWNGYRDTVIDGVTGVRVPTVMSASGAGSDLAQDYNLGKLSYDRTIGYSAMGAAVDCDAFAKAAQQLAEHPERRRAMGNASRAMALERYDVPVVFNQYRALCEALAQRRAHGEQAAVGRLQRVPDLYGVFCDHPSHCLAESDRLRLTSLQAAQNLYRFYQAPLVDFAHESLLPWLVLQELVRWLTLRICATAGQVEAAFPDQPKPALLRSLVWLLKYDILCLDTAPKLENFPSSLAERQGNQAFQAGDFTAACGFFHQALAAAPMNFRVRCNFLMALKAGKRHEGAEIVAQSLIEEFPQSWQAHYEYGRFAYRLKRYEEAEKHYLRAKDLNPDRPDIYNQLGLTLGKLKRDDEAIEAFRKALSIDPKYKDAYCNIGNIYLLNYNCDLAISEYEKIFILFPNDGQAHLNLGIAYKGAGDLGKAEKHLAKAMALAVPRAAHSLALLLLAQGRFTQGWQAYRWPLSGDKPEQALGLPSLEALAGKILHVSHEQGLGDEIFFARFLPQLMACGIEVRYAPQKKIASLLRRADAIGSTVVESLPAESAEFHLKIGDAPLLLGHGDGDPLPPSLTVRPLAHKLAEARQILASADGPYLGVAWRDGQEDEPGRLLKQVPLANLALAVRCYPGAIVILQRHPKEGEIAYFHSLVKRPVIDASFCNDDLELMLALVDCLDDMAGVSNTNFHLRALCHRDGDVLIPVPPEFRWFYAGDVSPWFPAMRLWRQDAQGDWALPMLRLKAALIDRRGRCDEEIGPLGEAEIEPVRAEMRAGRFVAALSMCQSLAARDPAHAHLAMLTGTCLLAMKRAREAIGFFEQAILRKENYVDAMINCGVAYEKINKYDTSVKYYTEAIKINPELYKIHINIGLANEKVNNYNLAIKAYSKAIDGDPDYIDAYNNLALLLIRLSRHDEAVEALRHLVRLRPERCDYWRQYSFCLYQSRAIDRALAALLEVRRLRPGQPKDDALEGRILLAADRPEAAEQVFRQILEARPSYLTAKVFLLQIMLDDRTRQEEALSLLGEIWPERERLGPLWLDLYRALRSHAYLVEAETLAREAMLRKDDQWQSAMTHIAIAYLAAAEEEKADAIYREILTVDPANDAILSTQALSYLSVGQWEKGWRTYLKRNMIRDVSAFLSRDPLPLDLSGMRILLRREQGIGDELFFMRYAPELKRRGAWLGYTASAKMLPLMQRLPFLDRVVLDNSKLPAHDRYITLGDLPWLLGWLDEASLAPSLRLCACPQRLEAMNATLAALGVGPYIGVAWRAGDPTRLGLYKEIPRTPFAKALRSWPGTIICLQRLASDYERSSFERALGRSTGRIAGIDDDMEDNLALMSSLDELVGVSNTNLHVRALTGRPSRALVPYPPDFRWMHRPCRSPWFPDVQTYRQEAKSGWAGVFERLQQDLESEYRS